MQRPKAATGVGVGSGGHGLGASKLTLNLHELPDLPLPT